MNFQTPILKFIEGKEMVRPITKDGYILSHKDYVNYYYPLSIEIIDYKGNCFTFKKASITGKVLVIPSIIHLSVMYKIQPEFTEKPRIIKLNEFIEKVIFYINISKKKFHIDREELNNIIIKVGKCTAVHEVINLVHSYSYWK
jgi:hypothetical protein